MALLLPGQSTITQVRAAVRSRTDTINSQFVTDAEINAFIDASNQELYGLIVQKFGNDYFFSGSPDNWYQVTQTGNSASFPLPDGSGSFLLLDNVTIAPAVFKVLGVDLRIYGQNNGWLTLKPFQFADRNRYTYPQAQSGYGLSQRMSYRIAGNYIWTSPTMSAGQVLRIFYVPRPITLADTGTITIASVQPGTTLTINSQVFTAIGGSSGAVAPQFNTGASNAACAANLLAAIQAYPLLTPAVFTASVSSNTIMLSLGPGAITWTTSSPANIQFGIPSVATGLPSGSANGFVFPTAAPATWGSTIYGVNGWEEYIVIDAAIKVAQKEESDVSILGAEKMAILARIESEAENRDAGSPVVVADVRGRYGNGGYQAYDSDDGSGYP